MKVRMVDPPSGWMYGFPCECPDGVWDDHERFKAFLLEHGYPPEDVEFAASYVRVWFVEKEDE